MTNGSAPAGWYQDPTGQGNARYWNGTSWTQSVNRNGSTVNVAIDPSQAQVAPVPGTQDSIPPPPTNRSSGPSHSLLGIIFGVILVLFLVLLTYAIVSNNDSSDDGPPATGVPSVTEAPAAPATEGG